MVKISHLRVTSFEEETHSHVTALIRSHYAKMSRCSVNLKQKPPLTEESSLRYLDGLSKSAHGQMHQTAVALLWSVEEIHQKGYMTSHGQSADQFITRFYVRVLSGPLVGSSVSDGDNKYRNRAYGLTVLNLMPSRAWITPSSRVMERTAP